ncbi:MAG: tetratricopeptide repeat protein [Planctomycetota bacterium]
MDEQIATFDDPGRLDRELASVNAEIEVAPTAKLLRKRGVLLAMQREFSLAIAAFDAAITLEPEDADAFYNRGAVYSQIGNVQDAIDDYTSAIEADADHSLAYSNRGMEYLQREEFDAALCDLQIAIRLNPDDHPGMHAMAIVYLERDDKHDGDVIKAMQLTKKACELTNYEYDLYVETLVEIERLLNASLEPDG